jgi:hypothetical protein
MATDPRDYKLDISSLKDDETDADEANAGRKFIGVTFACCNVYNRVYINREGTAYDARCPRCGRSMRFAVGPGGTDQRSFVVE